MKMKKQTMTIGRAIAVAEIAATKPWVYTKQEIEAARRIIKESQINRLI
jgi:hypothetical protein